MKFDFILVVNMNFCFYSCILWVVVFGVLIITVSIYTRIIIDVKVVRVSKNSAKNNQAFKLLFLRLSLA
jgi:hypothetical protein